MLHLHILVGTNLRQLASEYSKLKKHGWRISTKYVNRVTLQSGAQGVVHSWQLHRLVANPVRGV